MDCKSLEFDRCCQTIREMLMDRGYGLDEVGVLVDSHAENATWEQALPHLLAEHPVCLSGPTALFLVCVWQPDPPNHYVFSKVECLLQENLVTYSTNFPVALPARHIMVVTQNALRMTDNKDFSGIQKRHRVEIFVQADLQFNRTHHELVPKHELLPRDQGFAILRALNTMPSQCPRILTSDVICRYYGGQVGDLFRIHRWDRKTGEHEITYRIVVPY
jgi:DNA-directed RNA polymerase subunit H (RpoH/RPB5)